MNIKRSGFHPAAQREPARVSDRLVARRVGEPLHQRVALVGQQVVDRGGRPAAEEFGVDEGSGRRGAGHDGHRDEGEAEAGPRGPSPAHHGRDGSGGACLDWSARPAVAGRSTEAGGHPVHRQQHTPRGDAPHHDSGVDPDGQHRGPA